MTPKALRSLIAEIAALADMKLKCQGGVSVTTNFPLVPGPIHRDVHTYFRFAAPQDSMVLSEYVLSGKKRLREENGDGWYRFLQPHKFVVIGSTHCGDILALQTSTGRVVLFSHESTLAEALQFWPQDPLPLTTRELLAEALEKYQSIEEFLMQWREREQKRDDEFEAFIEASVHDPNARDADGWTPLQWAIAIDEEESLRNLIRRGADVNLPANEEGETPLFLACTRKDPGFARILIKAGADVNHRNREGKTPLMHAVRHSRLPCIRQLLKAGADPRKRDHTRRGVLSHICSVHGTPAIRRTLESAIESARRSRKRV